MPNMPTPFSCAVVPRRQAVHVCPAGEIDLSTVPELDARLAELHLAGFGEIVLDLSRVTFFDSCGVHLVMRWTRQAADEHFNFAVVAGTAVVERVLQLTGVKPDVSSVEPHVVDGARDGGLPASASHLAGPASAAG